jgi:hypothetical protein
MGNNLIDLPGDLLYDRRLLCSLSWIVEPERFARR